MQINANLLAEVPKILNPLEIQSARQDAEYKRQANEINALKLREALSEIATKNQRATELKAFRTSNPSAKPIDYANAGYMDEAKSLQDIYVSDADIQEKNLKIAHDKADYLGNMLGTLGQDQELNEAKFGATLRDAVGRGYLSQEEARQAYAEFPRDPVQARQWLRQQELSTMSAKERLPKVGMQDLGGQVVPYSQDLYGNVNTGTPIEKTMSPSDMRQMEEGALNRGVTMRGQDITARGQNLTDLREREKLAQSPNGYSTKPLPATSLKMQNEALDKLTITKNNNNALQRVIDQLDGGKLDLGLVENVTGNVRNRLGISTESSRNLSSFKSTLEKLRNDSLRLNTGVQTDGDAKRAWNELIENINDPKLVKQRLQEIQEINTRGAELQKLQVENIRANYNAEPIDFTRYDSATSGNVPSINKNELNSDKQSRYEAWKKAKGLK